jgi:hypothetical protein
VLRDCDVALAAGIPLRDCAVPIVCVLATALPWGWAMGVARGGCAAAARASRTCAVAEEVVAD